jgi:hypothetical protein
MARTKSLYSSGQLAVPTPAGGNVVAHVRAEVTLTAAVAIGDVLDFLPLPAGYVVVDYALENDDCDTGTTAVGDLGVLDSAGTAVSTAAADGTAWLAASSALQAAAFTRNSAQAAAKQIALARMTPSATDRTLAFVVTTAGTGGVGGKVALHVWYKAD